MSNTFTKTIIKGAESQFGKEFGRAAANKILKGANSYTIEQSGKYGDRINPSDSEIIKTIKEIKRIEFITKDKGNITRLIQITNSVISNIKFEGDKTPHQLADVSELLHVYEEKFEFGKILIDASEGKELDFLNNKRKEFEILIDEFNSQTIEYIKKRKRELITTLKTKKTASFLSFLLGTIGAQWFYLDFKKKGGFGILSLLFFWSLIPTIIGVIMGIQFLIITNDDFNKKYNMEYYFYNQFKF